MKTLTSEEIKEHIAKINAIPTSQLEEKRFRISASEIDNDSKQKLLNACNKRLNTQDFLVENGELDDLEGGFKYGSR